VATVTRRRARQRSARKRSEREDRIKSDECGLGYVSGAEEIVAHHKRKYVVLFYKAWCAPVEERFV
jgi:hypothetical protein